LKRIIADLLPKEDIDWTSLADFIPIEEFFFYLFIKNSNLVLH
jgi:hypothetical protein